MRGLLVIVAVAVLAAAWWLFARGERHDAPPTPTGPEAAGNAPPGAADGGLVATRLQVAAPPAVDLADAPAACLCVVDHTTNQPIAGAPIRRVQTGAEIAFTDERGIAPLPLRAPEQLAVVVEDYLLGLVPTQLGSTETEPQEVRLVRDQWSIVRRLDFDGARGDVFVRFRPRQPNARAPSPVGGDDAVQKRAWDMHTMLAGRPVCADVPVQLGAYDENRVHRLANGTAMRFLAPGEFAIEAATADGLVGNVTARIDATPRTGAPTIRVPMTAGAFVTGTVVDAAGAPLADATLTLQGGDPLGLAATTRADGVFRFGPLPIGPATLHVRHGDHQPLAFGPFALPATEVRIALQPLAGTTLRGRVRARPSGRPIAGATIQWAPHGSAAVTATSAADGTFALRATGAADARLAISAPGYVAYAEIAAPNAPFADYDLWPGTTAERLDAGITALLEGVVLDGNGAPVVHADVRWTPAQRPAPAGLPARRALEGATLELPYAARTGADGAFRLETHAFGPGRVSLAGGTAGVDVTAIAGKATSNLLLRP